MAYTTADLINAELRSTVAFSTNTIPALADVEVWIDETESWIDNISQQRFERTNETVYFDYDGRGDTLMFKHTPLLAISSLEYSEAAVGSDTYPDWTTLTEFTHYVPYEDQGRIDLVYVNKTFKTGKRRFKANIDYGYDTVPGYIQELATKMVTDRVLRSLLNNNQDNGNDGGTVQVGSIKIVEPSSFGVNSYKQLNADIEEGKKRLVDNSGVQRFNG